MELTGASEATVRRDFADLEAEGLVSRHRGGVEAAAGRDDGSAGVLYGGLEGVMGVSAPLESRSLESRRALREEAKRLIAERASLLCAEGQTVFLDAGSTTLALAELIAGMRVRVVTNSFAAARILFETGVAEIVLVGGAIDRASEVVYSHVDDHLIESYLPDVAFLSAEGVDAAGVSNSDERLIRTERRALSVARRAVLVADSSKFGKRGRVRVCGVEELEEVVTDSGLPENQHDLLRERGVHVITVR